MCNPPNKAFSQRSRSYNGILRHRSAPTTLTTSTSSLKSSAAGLIIVAGEKNEVGWKNKQTPTTTTPPTVVVEEKTTSCVDTRDDEGHMETSSIALEEKRDTSPPPINNNDDKRLDNLDRSSGSALSTLSVFTNNTIATEAYIIATTCKSSAANCDDAKQNGYVEELRKNKEKTREQNLEEAIEAIVHQEHPSIKDDALQLQSSRYGCDVMSVFQFSEGRGHKNALSSLTKQHVGAKTMKTPLEIIDEDHLLHLLEIKASTSTQQMSNIDQDLLRHQGLPLSPPEDYPVIRQAILTAERESRKAQRKLRRIERDSYRVDLELSSCQEGDEEYEDGDSVTTAGTAESEDGFFDLIAAVLRYTVGGTTGRRKDKKKGSVPSSTKRPVMPPDTVNEGYSKLLFL